MKKFISGILFIHCTYMYATAWESLVSIKIEHKVNLTGRIVIDKVNPARRGIFLCEANSNPKNNLDKCIAIISNSNDLESLKSYTCANVTGTFRAYSGDFIFMGNGGKIGLLTITSKATLKSC